MSTKRALKATLWQGAFSGERSFEIRRADGTAYQGISPVEYCWDERDRALRPGQPKARIRGKIACRLLREEEGGYIASLPDGEVVRVSRAAVVERPAECGMDVPV